MDGIHSNKDLYFNRLRSCDYRMKINNILWLERQILKPRCSFPVYRLHFGEGFLSPSDNKRGERVFTLSPLLRAYKTEFGLSMIN